MSEEPTLGRVLWAVLLSAVVALVIFSFARHPLLGDDGEASGFSRPLTLWIAGAEDNGQAEATARQLAGCWQLAGRSVTVGTLPGGSASAVVDFLDRVRGIPDELLLVTSTTLSDIARDIDDPLLPEPRERARRAERLLERAPPIAVLEGGRLALAVRAHSPIRDSSQLFALLDAHPSRPLLGVAADTWLEGNLAALVSGSGLRGSIPYTLFTSSRSAALSLAAGQLQAVLAAHESIRQDLARGRLRELPWPGAGGADPRTWVAVLAPAGRSAHAVRVLRAQAHGLCGASAGRRRKLREEGFAPVAPARSGVASAFLADSMREAVRLQSLAARIIRAY